MAQQCSARSKTSGNQCRKDAVAGATVCRIHGGAAPQVVAAARIRLMEAADPAAALLVRQMAGKLVNAKGKLLPPEQQPDDNTRQKAALAILDRAGLKPTDRLEISGPGGGPVRVEGELDLSKIPTEELELMLAQQERLEKLGAIKPASSASSMVVDTAAKQVTDGRDDDTRVP